MTQNLVMSPSLGCPALTLVMAENYADVGKSSCRKERGKNPLGGSAKALPDRWDWNESLVGLPSKRSGRWIFLGRGRESMRKYLVIPLSMSLADFRATFTIWMEAFLAALDDREEEWDGTERRHRLTQPQTAVLLARSPRLKSVALCDMHWGSSTDLHFVPRRRQAGERERCGRGYGDYFTVV